MSVRVRTVDQPSPEPTDPTETSASSEAKSKQGPQPLNVNSSVSSIFTSWAAPALSITRNIPLLISKRETSFGFRPNLPLTSPSMRLS
ncbi:Uncharacterised protein [uncultured archaeon]|nr:Uncharacterised protein [uncultured archaeon]